MKMGNLMLWKDNKNGNDFFTPKFQVEWSGTKLPAQWPTSRKDIISFLRSEGFKHHIRQPPFLAWQSAPGRRAPTTSGCESQQGFTPGEPEGYWKLTVLKDTTLYHSFWNIAEKEWFEKCLGHMWERFIK